MKFVIGIGNPDKNYDKTRHNIGFAVVDKLQNILKKSGEVMLVKPRTYVNRTGDAVLSILKKYPRSGYGTGLNDFLFVCDDVNLMFGKMRLREAGSSGGHHGLESVIQAVNSENFPRLRVGVGHETMPEDLTGFVLEKFSEDEEKQLDTLLKNAAFVCESWATEGLQKAMDLLSRLQTK